jgi:hypothetical protein
MVDIIIEEFNKKHNAIKVIAEEEEERINYLKLTMHRTDYVIKCGVYKKTISTVMAINYSRHAEEYKEAAFTYIFYRMDKVTLDKAQK